MPLASYTIEELQDEIARRRKEDAPELVSIVEITAKSFGVHRDDLFSESHAALISKARYASWLILLEKGFGTATIARAFNRKDRTTIDKGKARGRFLIETEPEFAMRLRTALERSKAFPASEC
jgi:chromosomal replication initiation ATPase DnaA